MNTKRQHFVTLTVFLKEEQTDKEAEIEAAFMTDMLCQYTAHCYPDVEVEVDGC